MGFGRSHGWRRPKCRLRRSVRPVGRDEGTREAGGLPGRRLLVLFANKEWVFQKSLAKPRSGGETPSRAKPSPKQKPQPKRLRFFIGSSCWHQQANRPYARRQLVLPALSSSTIPISVRRALAASAAAQFLSARA